MIRTCKNVKLMDGSKTDVKVTVDLECKEYEALTAKIEGCRLGV